jgi:hypothetical protein
LVKFFTQDSSFLSRALHVGEAVLEHSSKGDEQSSPAFLQISELSTLLKLLDLQSPETTELFLFNTGRQARERPIKQDVVIFHDSGDQAGKNEFLQLTRHVTSNFRANLNPSAEREDSENRPSAPQQQDPNLNGGGLDTPDWNSGVKSPITTRPIVRS